MFEICVKADALPTKASDESDATATAVIDLRTLISPPWESALI